MKSNRTRSAWMVSLLIHLGLAAIFAHITINHDLLNDNPINVTILRVSPTQPQPRKPLLEPPTVSPLAVAPPDLTLQPTLSQTRAVAVHQGRSMAQPNTTAVARVDSLTSQPRLQARHSSIAAAPPASTANLQPASSLATMADLPVQPESPLISGLNVGGSLASDIGDSGGLRERMGQAVIGGGAAGRNGSDGLASLVGSAGAANINASLEGVTDHMALGNALPELPLGAPGAIVVGRGRDIVGRLNLVRFEDPLHPDADLCGSGVGNLRFGAGLTFLVRSMNQYTRIQTRLVDAVTITDAAFFQTPIIFMEPIPRSLIRAHDGRFTNAPIWRIRRPERTHDYTESDAQRLREYVVNNGGFIYMAAHGNTPETLRPTIRVLRQILPEYQLTHIPNDHEIYNTYYSLNGPLRYPVRKIGNAILHYGQYSELQGVFVDGRLAVLVDTEAMMHVLDGAVQKPFYGVYADRNKVLDEFAPHAARQLINIVIYAITHGKISDYRNYVPAPHLNNADSVDIPKKAPYIPGNL